MNADDIFSTLPSYAEYSKIFNDLLDAKGFNKEVPAPIVFDSSVLDQNRKHAFMARKVADNPFHFRWSAPSAIVPDGTNYAVFIVDIFFGPRATCVKWSDGVVTVVKLSPYDDYDPYVAVSMCITKRMFGNMSAYKRAVNSAHENALKRGAHRIERFKRKIKKAGRLFSKDSMKLLHLTEWIDPVEYSDPSASAEESSFFTEDLPKYKENGGDSDDVS